MRGNDRGPLISGPRCVVSLPIDARFRDPVANPASGILAMADRDW